MEMFRGRMLFIASIMSLAGALRLETSTHQEPSPEAPPPGRPYTAFCVVGDANTLPFASMHVSLARFVLTMNGTGLTKPTPDFFAYLTLQGAPGRDGYAYLADNTTEEQALYAVYAVGPIAYKFKEDRYEVTPENMDQFVKNRDVCFTNGVWQDSWRAMRRSVNQLVQWQQCMKMITHEERIVGKKYDVVVLARPDLAYRAETQLDLNLVASGTVLGQKDWIMVMPRKVAGGLISKKAKPLSCKPGEACCGRVGSGATMLEYLTGIGNRMRLDSCDCGPSVKESGIVEQKMNLFIGRVITPNLLMSTDRAMTGVPFETVMTEHDEEEEVELI